MQIRLLIIVFILIGNIIAGKSPATNSTPAVLFNKSRIINTQDSVIFDLSHATITGNFIDIPVFFLSDDIVNSFDFSFKFDETILTYDSVINYKNYLTALPNFNTTDRKLRFTSNSLQTIENNTALIAIRFTFTNICLVNETNLNTIKVYLNGNPCTSKVSPVAHFIPVANFTSNKFCSGTSIALSDASLIATGSISSWAWDFGNGTTSNLQNPVTSYSTTGNYTVTVIVTSDRGCKDTLVKPVTVNASPVSNFSFLTNCNTDTVKFTDNSSIAAGTVTGWTWNFGDSNTSNQHNPYHSYASGGTYTVSLQAMSDSGCTASSAQTVIVSTPTAAFTAANGCTGSGINFTDNSTLSSGAINTWHWYFGDGNTSLQQSPAHIYSAAGTYTVSLKITTNLNCSDSVTKIVSIENKPIVKFGADSLSGCVPLNINFSDSSVTATGSTYFWDFGDTHTSASKNITYTYTNSGVYTVKHIVTTSAGCTDSLIKAAYITVNATPLANFTVVNGCTTSPLNFTDGSSISSGTISGWHWYFGDGTTSTQQNPVHSYTTAGTYTVSLKVNTGQHCYDSVAKIITIQNTPTVKFGGNSLAGCAPLHVNFSDSSLVTGTAVYFWDFGDGQTSSVKNPNHTYTSNGIYTVKHIVTNSNGCTDSLIKTAYIHVNGTPIAAFTSTSACTGSLINYTDISTVSPGTINGWHWDFGDGGTATQQNPTHIYSNPGTYIVSLVVSTGQACSDSTTQTINIQSKPLVKFGGDDLSGCMPLHVNFSDSSTTVAGSTYFWDFGDAQTSALKNPAHTYLNSGTYTVKHIVSASAGCSDSLIKTAYINVYDLPSAGFTATNGCALVVVNFTDNSGIASGTISSWNWSFGDGNTSSQHNPSYVYSVAGTYTVSLKANSNHNCMDSTTRVITIENKPLVKFGGDTLAGCMPLTVNFSDSSITAAGSSYLWSFGDTHTSSLKDAANNYTASGLYTIKHIVTTPVAGCTDSLIKTNYIKVYGIPTALFLAKPDTAKMPDAYVSFNNLSVGDNSWHWDFGDGDSSLNQAPVHTYTSAGVYTVCLVVHNTDGCAGTFCEPITVLTPDPVAIPNAFTPNGDGNNDVLKVRGGPMAEMEFHIFNQWGNDVFFASTQNDGWDGRYKGNAQPEGVYEYTMKGKTIDNKIINLHGVVNLVR